MESIAKHGFNSFRLILADSMVRLARLVEEVTSKSVERRQAAGCGTTQAMVVKIGSGIISFFRQESIWANLSS